MQRTVLKRLRMKLKEKVLSWWNLIGDEVQKVLYSWMFSVVQTLVTIKDEQVVDKIEEEEEHTFASSNSSQVKQNLGVKILALRFAINTRRGAQKMKVWNAQVAKARKARLLSRARRWVVFPTLTCDDSQENPPLHVVQLFTWFIIVEKPVASWCEGW